MSRRIDSTTQVRSSCSWSVGLIYLENALISADSLECNLLRESSFTGIARLAFLEDLLLRGACMLIPVHVYGPRPDDRALCSQ